jgi:glycosyltransferase involved in cell wall biosynthesis
VGDGPARADLERLGVPGVRFAGRLAPEQVRELMLAGRALAFPSRSYEGQPMVVLEALAAGLPVLASDLGGLPELLRPTGAGWLAPPGDVAGWTGALRGLTQTAPVVQASAAALRLYQQVFTEERAARALEDAYERARARQL